MKPIHPFNKVLFIAYIAVLSNDVHVNAQSTSSGAATGNNYTAAKYLGWGGTSGDLLFKTNNTTRLILKNTTGNFGIGFVPGTPNPIPPSLLSVGTAWQFQVTSTGDIIRIKGLTYSFPTTQGAAGTMTMLQNDGLGNLSWSADAWSRLGNAGAIDGTHFIGTTDNKPFNIRVNNQKAGRIDNTLANTFFGYTAGNSNTTGSYNTATGLQALYFNITGTGNTASGALALYSNKIGYNNTASGSNALRLNETGNTNTACGYSALDFNSIGSNNTATGGQALYSNVAGSNATAIGFFAMRYANNQAAAFTSYNVAVGFEALRGSITASANTGNNNTALGYQSLWGNSSGSFNTANGVTALYNNSTGDNNTANGFSALRANTSGINNTALGVSALSNNTTANNNIAIGSFALQTQSFSNGGVAWNSDNVAIGFQSLYSNQPVSSASTWGGTHNTAIGNYTLKSNINGHSNTAIGYYALASNTIGFGNTANGENALANNTTGMANTANGSQALYFNTSGLGNTAQGVGALGLNTTGNTNTAQGLNALNSNNYGGSNTANGYAALSNNTQGNFNTGHGGMALQSNTTGNNNTAIGYGADVSSGALNNATAIGYNAKVSTSNSLVLGGTGPDAVKVGIGTTSPSSTLDVKGAISGFGIVPIGSIIAWHKSLTGTSPLPDGWVECNGDTLNDLNSPYNGQVIPDLNPGKRFLRGADTSGIMQSDQLRSHKHIEPGHQHYIGMNGTGQGGGYGAYATSYNGNIYTPHVTNPVAVQLGDPVDTATGAAIPNGNETRPINMSVVWIMRIK